MNIIPRGKSGKVFSVTPDLPEYSQTYLFPTATWTYNYATHLITRQPFSKDYRRLSLYIGSPQITQIDYNLKGAATESCHLQ